MQSWPTGNRPNTDENPNRTTTDCGVLDFRFLFAYALGLPGNGKKDLGRSDASAVSSPLAIASPGGGTGRERAWERAVCTAAAAHSLGLRRGGWRCFTGDAMRARLSHYFLPRVRWRASAC